MAGGTRDLSKLGAVRGFAQWLLKQSGALVVIVIRVDDLAIAADPKMRPADTVHLIHDRAEELHQMLQAERVAARELAERKRAREEKRVGR